VSVLSRLRSACLRSSWPCLLVFFGHLTPAVEDLRYRNRYHPISVEDQSPALAAVLDAVTAGRFGDPGIFEPFINTIRHGDYYLIADDFDSCEYYCMHTCDNSTDSSLGWTDLSAQKLVDDAYQKDPSEWIKKSIHTSAKVRESFLSLGLCLGGSPL